jgi:SAM-dependent methyltransferase
MDDSGAIMSDSQQRKALEAQFHDKLRDPALRTDPILHAKLTSNKKWYSIAGKSWRCVQNYLQAHSEGAKALDFACGDGTCSFVMAEAGASVVGIDISETSVRNAEREAAQRGLNARFQVMDCENMTFPDSTFDLVSVSGVLHHLDLDSAFSELARVLKSTGIVVCAEPLAHNPVFQTYRKLTPHLRTEFEAEHILRRRDVMAARKYFNHIDLQFFHLLDLGAVPFRNTRIFNPLLSGLQRIDSLLFRATPLRWWAWQVLFVLSEPRKLETSETTR